MSPRIHREAERLVRERKATDYRAACALIARRPRKRNRLQQPLTREIRLPYRDD